jgi:hypothetical protein
VSGRKLQLRLIVALGWLLLVTGVSFMRGPTKDYGRPDEPATWKLVVWLVLFFVLVPASFVLPTLLKGG